MSIVFTDIICAWQGEGTLMTGFPAIFACATVTPEDNFEDELLSPPWAGSEFDSTFLSSAKIHKDHFIMSAMWFHDKE